MANRQSRGPGEIRRFDANAQIRTDIPSSAVDTGDTARALMELGGSLSTRLRQLADNAAAREGALAGLADGQKSGASYLAARAVEDRATARAQSIEGGKAYNVKDPVATELPIYARAFLNSVSGGESGGDYNVRYTPKGPAHFSDLSKHPRIFENGPHGKTSAAGRYQFTATTWDSVGGGDFSAKNQDIRAWQLAQRDYKTNTGRSLDADLQKGGLTPGIVSALSPTWQAFTKNTADHIATYRDSLSRLGNGAPAVATDPLITGSTQAPIDLDRPKIENADGSFSTERTITIDVDEGGKRKWLNIPTIVNGKEVSEEEAVKLFRSGKNKPVGEFGSLKEAEKAAVARSEEIGELRENEPLSTVPLQLRNDGTIRGAAYDKAADQAFSWRLQQGLSTDMQNAYDQFQDNPEAFAQELVNVREKYLQNDTFKDPQLLEMFDKQFADRSEAYVKAVSAESGKRLRQEQQVSAAEGIQAQSNDIERQAYLLGGSPDADRIISGQVERVSRSIDNAVQDRILTPAQGSEAKEKIAETAAKSRIQGVFSALDSAEKKEAFALGILDDWSKGEGPLAQMPLNTVKSLSDTLYRDAREQANKEKAANSVERARITSLINDDISSVAATGKGLSTDENGITPDKVGSLLGSEKLAEWQEKRAFAGKVWEASAGMEADTEEEITTRLATLAPKAGTPGYADQEKIFDQAAKRAAKIIKERADDPAMSVQTNFPEVKALAEVANPDDPNSMQALVAARLQAQEAVGVPDLAQAPLTNDEAFNLSRAISTVQDPRAQNQAVQQLVGQVSAAYGPYAEKAFSQVMQAKGVDKELSGMGTALFFKMNRGERPTRADQRNIGVLGETASAENGVTARKPDAWPIPGSAARIRITQNPNETDQFDAVYGPGAAAEVLRTNRMPINTDFQPVEDNNGE